MFREILQCYPTWQKNPTIHLQKPKEKNNSEAQGQKDTANIHVNSCFKQLLIVKTKVIIKDMNLYQLTLPTTGPLSFLLGLGFASVWFIICKISRFAAAGVEEGERRRKEKEFCKSLF